MSKNKTWGFIALPILLLGGLIAAALYYELTKVPDEGEGYMQESQEEQKGYLDK